MTTKFRNRIAAAFRAEMSGVDLQERDGRIYVFSQDKDGQLRELGHVSTDAAAQDPAGALMMIERIKFHSRVTP